MRLRTLVLALALGSSLGTLVHAKPKQGIHKPAKRPKPPKLKPAKRGKVKQTKQTKIKHFKRAKSS